MALVGIFRTPNAFLELLALVPYHLQRHKKRRVNDSLVGRDRWARRVQRGGPSGPALPKAPAFFISLNEKMTSALRGDLRGQRSMVAGPAFRLAPEIDGVGEDA